LEFDGGAVEEAKNVLREGLREGRGRVDEELKEGRRG
jgi:hypothetical protein